MDNQVKIDANVANEGRRFTLLVENISPTLAGDSLIVSGNLHGKVNKGDSVYVFLPRSCSEAKVLGIEAFVEEKLTVVEEACDTKVNLSLDITDMQQVKILSVVTSIKPVEKFDPMVPMENPYLAGLLFEAARYQKDNNFMIVLSFLLTTSKYLVPLKPQMTEDGKQTMGFYMLPAKKPENEGELPKEFYFPVFTDFQELSKWTALTKQNPKVPTTVMNFKQLSEFVKPEPTVGIIVNPFSKNMIIAREELVNSIVNSEGFKKEFSIEDKE